MALQTRAPTSDASITGTSWSGTAGSRFTLVNDHPDATGATVLSCGTATAGTIFFGFSPFTVPAGSTIQSVVVRYYDQKTGGAGSLIDGRLRIDTSAFDVTAHDPANGVWTLRTETFATNPKSGLAWSVAEVNGTAATNNLTGFGVNVGDANPLVSIASIQLEVNYTAGNTGTFASTLAGVTSALSGKVTDVGVIGTGAGIVQPAIRMTGTGLVRNGPGYFQSLTVVSQGVVGPLNLYDGVDATGTPFLTVAAPVTGQTYFPGGGDRLCSNIWVTHGGTSQTVDYQIDDGVAVPTVQLAGVTAALAGTVTDVGTFASTLAGVTMAASGQVVLTSVTGTFASTLVGVTSALSGIAGSGGYRSFAWLDGGGAGAQFNPVHAGYRSFMWFEGGGAGQSTLPTGTIAATLQGVTANFNLSVALGGTINPTLVGATLAAAGFVGNAFGGFRSFAWMEGGGAQAAAAVPPIIFPLDEGLPIAWRLDPGFAALYQFAQDGMPVATRDQVGGNATGALASTLDGASMDGELLVAQTITGTIAVTLGADTMAASINVGAPSGTIGTILDGIITADLRGQIIVPGLLASTLDGATLAAAGAVTQYASGTFASTLAGASMQAGLFVGTPGTGQPWRWIRVSNITLGL